MRKRLHPFTGKKDSKQDRVFLAREKESLRILNRLQHPNIVRLLGSYTHGLEHCFLFEWFPMDLEKFFKQETRPEGFEQNFKFYVALEKLCSAIAKVHHLNLDEENHGLVLERIGYHHDIRPANVLVNPDGFYLADFGLSRMKPGDADPKTKWKAGLGSYVGPECRTSGFQNMPVGRALDIWSFGCMISEIVAYIEGGKDGVVAFQGQRKAPSNPKFPQMKDQNFYSGDVLKPSVVAWFESQKEASKFRDLLDVAMSMLQTDPTKRPDANTVHQKLMFLSIKASFQAIEQSLLNIIKSSDSSFLAEIEYGRFRAWGNVLELMQYNVSAESIKHMGEKSSKISDSLLVFLRGLDSHKKLSEATLDIVVFPLTKQPVEEIRAYVQDLWDLLPDLQERFRHTWLVDLMDTSSPEYLQMKSGLHPYEDLREFASAKLGKLHLGDSGRLTSSFSLNPDSFQIDDVWKDHEIGRYQGQPVLIEWVVENWSVVAESEERRINLFVDSYKEIKSSSFYVLDCLGFLVSSTDQRQRCGFVFSFPPPTSTPPVNNKRAIPKNLYDFLGKEKMDLVLPLGERFRLAHKLAKCVDKLHMAGWLHRNICSRDIVFFEEGNVQYPWQALNSPYLINFRDSRPSDKAGLSTRSAKQGDPREYSKHPEYSAGSGFKQVYDYYSLGLVLLEIGAWVRLDECINKYRSKYEGFILQPSEFRSWLIEKMVPRLGILMGNSYRDATSACLECRFESGGAGGALSTEFFDKVVAPLERLSSSPI